MFDFTLNRGREGPKEFLKDYTEVLLADACGDYNGVVAGNRGFSVTGVDKTKYLLDKARANARAAHAKIEWIEKDMRDFVRADSFALVLSMFTSFGYFDDKREDLIVLKNMFASLRPGGACLIELLGKEHLARIFQPTTSTLLPDGTVVVERQEVSDDWTRVQNEWLVIRNSRVKRFKSHHTVYSGQELRDRMEHAGFVGVTLHGNLDGDEYGANAERLITIGRKAISKHREKGPNGASRNTEFLAQVLNSLTGSIPTDHLEISPWN